MAGCADDRRGDIVLKGTVEASFLILLVVVVFGPAVAERFRVPAIIGLIFGGTLFGPFVLGWLEADELVTELGAIGILYLMFVAGITFDIQAFNINRRSAMTYGLLGFVLPFGLTVVVGLAFGAGLLASSLVGAMWASNTLVAYPEVQKAGLQKNRAVSAAVSAGVVADLLSLTVLAVATTTAVIELEPLDDQFGRRVSDLLSDQPIEPTTPDPTLPLWIALPLLVAFCLWLLPRLTEVFFVRVGRSRIQRFVFALAGMSAGATVALLGGVEGLIGAFMAGLGMNRLVPNRGLLMERIEFVGAAIFVPTFLVSIGLNIDPTLLVDPATLGLGLLFTGFVVVGKASAAAITSRIFGFSGAEFGLMSSLSFGQAASTLAIAQVGLSLGMFEQIVVNAAVIAIVVTALITSYGTRFFADRVPRPADAVESIGATVMLDIREHGSDPTCLASVAAAIAEHDAGVVMPYLVTDPGGLKSGASLIDAATATLSRRGLDAEGIVRVDESFESGTVHLVEERSASLVVLSWAGPKFASDYLLGNNVDGTGERCPVPAMAVRVLREWDRVVVFVGKTDTPWRLEDARLAVDSARRLVADEQKLVVVTLSGSDAPPFVADLADTDGIEIVARREFDLARLSTTDLVVAPAHIIRDIPPRTGWRTSRSLDDLNVVIVAGAHRLLISKGVARQSIEPRPV